MTTYSLFHDAPQYATATFPTPRPFQEEAHEALRQGARNGHRCQMLMAPTGSGKCLGIDTPILMADGSIKPVQHVAIGDRLIGPDGQARNVRSTTIGREMLYRVIPKKGMSYVVNASHILSLRKTPGSNGLRLSNGGIVPKDSDVVNINVEVLLQSNATTRHCLKGWRADAIHLFDRNHEEDALDRLLPPYILGAWLGDGTMGRAAISKPECKMVDEWVGYGRSIGLPARKIARDPEDCPTWLLTDGHNGFSFNVVQAHIELLGVARRKHIPPQYKFGPISVRLELLAGLIDSDGYVEHGGCDWISVSNVLAEDFAFVCRSVGLSAYITPCKKGISASGFVGDYWRVSVSGDLSKIPMRDKIAAKRTQKKRHLVHGITIEPIGIGDYYGFEIDGDHLFLLGDFTVTHNTFLGLRAIHEALQKGKRAIFICDRRTLIEQTSAVADSYGLTAHSVLMADHWRYDPSSPFQIASAQTLARRQWPDSDLIVIDEAHVQMSVWVNKIKDCSAHVIGLSATPFSDGLGKLFSNLVCASSMHALTESGVLVPMRVFSCTKVNMRGAATAGGEWTDGAAAERGMEIIGDVVSEWKKFASDRKTIVFGATIAHCEEMARQFNSAGVMAACFTSDTSEVERKALLDEYRKPDSELRVLLSVSALAKGFDVQDVGCVCDVRPLRKSLSEAIQMWGRGLRSSPKTGKSDCLLLDFSGNVIRMADDFSDVFYNGLDALDAGEKLDKTIRRDDEEKPEGKACPVCGYQPMGKRCVSCGHEVIKPSLVEHEHGEMQEVRIGKTKYADDKRHLWEQACSYARGYSAPDKQQGRAKHIFRDITGEWPDSSWNIATTPSVQITRAVLNKIKSRNIAYAKSIGARAA